jgi:hypothetical protein
MKYLKYFTEIMLNHVTWQQCGFRKQDKNGSQAVTYLTVSAMQCYSKQKTKDDSGRSVVCVPDIIMPYLLQKCCIQNLWLKHRTAHRNVTKAFNTDIAKA